MGVMERVRSCLEHRYTAARTSAYVDGSLADGERLRVERHLERCEACRRDVATLRQTVSLLRGVPRLSVPRSFALPRSVQTEQARYRRWDTAFGALRSATLVASVLLVLLVSGDALLGATMARVPRAATGGQRVEDATYGYEAAGAEPAAAALPTAAAAGARGLGAEPEAAPEEPMAPQALAAPPPSGEAGAQEAEPDAELMLQAAPAAEAADPDTPVGAPAGEPTDIAGVPPATEPPSATEPPDAAGPPAAAAMPEPLPSPPAGMGGGIGGGAPSVEEWPGVPPHDMGAGPAAGGASPAAEPENGDRAAAAAAATPEPEGTPLPSRALGAPEGAPEPEAGGAEPAGAPEDAGTEEPQGEAAIAAAPVAEAAPDPGATPGQVARLVPSDDGSAPGSAAPEEIHESLALSQDPMWSIWQTLRIAAGLLLGVLLVLLSGLVWAAHKRRTP